MLLLLSIITHFVFISAPETSRSTQLENQASYVQYLEKQLRYQMKVNETAQSQIESQNAKLKDLSLENAKLRHSVRKSSSSTPTDLSMSDFNGERSVIQQPAHFDPLLFQHQLKQIQSLYLDLKNQNQNDFNYQTDLQQIYQNELINQLHDLGLNAAFLTQNAVEYFQKVLNRDLDPRSLVPDLIYYLETERAGKELRK
ncbi:Hypothetical_protein [Hexamita inflata]